MTKVWVVYKISMNMIMRIFSDKNRAIAWKDAFEAKNGGLWVEDIGIKEYEVH